jgi:hypothetical protein
MEICEWGVDKQWDKDRENSESERINTTSTTSGAGTAHPSGAHDPTPVFSGVRITRSLVLYVCFVDRFSSCCPFSFGHCFVCPSLIYGF